MLSTAVAGSAQVAPLSTDSYAQQITACSAQFAVANPPAGLTGDAAKEAAAAFLEASNAQTEVAGEAKFKLGEVAAEATDEEDGTSNTAEITAELTAIANAACAELQAIKTEYDATIAQLRAEATATPEQDKPEVKSQEKDKPEVEKPEVEKPEVQKPEQEKSDSSHGND